MPFGLKNAGMTFQRLIDRIFFDLPYSFIYLDDLLVTSRSVEDHRRHLREVLRRLQQNGLVVNRDKCVFGQRQVEFLGHTIAARGISPLPDRVAAIRRFPRPSTVRELQAFLGLFNFYRRFVPAAAAILRPLTDALSGSPSGTAAVSWSTASIAAFEAARTALADMALLDHPTADAQLSLVTDASATHVKASLQQRQQGQGWRLLGFYSQKLSPAETRYSALDRELLAIYSSILHFRHLLEGRNFVIFTDHLPLVGTIGRVLDLRYDRQRRQLSLIAEFSTEIRHISGPSNVVADALSSWGPPGGPLAGSTPVVAAAGLHHHPGSSSSSAAGELPSCAAATSPSVPAGVAAGSGAAEPPVDVRDIAAAQPACADCQRAASSPSLRVLEVDMSGHRLLVEVSSGVMRLLVPQQFRRAIFQAVHGLAHAGIRATRWFFLCVNSGGPVYQVGRSSTAEGHRRRRLRRGLIAGWVARYGVPSVVTSDRGVQFTSAFWAATMARFGVKHKLTTAFHPQANGAMERFHRRLKNSLRARLANSGRPQHLPWVMLGLRAAPREDSGLSAAELVFGAPLSLPGPVVTTAEAPLRILCSGCELAFHVWRRYRRQIRRPRQCRPLPLWPRRLCMSARRWWPLASLLCIGGCTR
jgi:transposase InsO family protein